MDSITQSFPAYFGNGSLDRWDLHDPFGNSARLENSPGIASCREVDEGDRATLHPAGKYEHFDPHKGC